MTQAFATASFFVLSWKWYLFGACLWGFYFWSRRRQRGVQESRQIDVRRAGRTGCQLALLLGAFAFALSPPTQWIYAAIGFVVGGVLGWAVCYHLARKPKARDLPQQTSGRLRDFLWVLLSVFSALAIAAITSKLGGSVRVALLIFWAASAGWVFVLALYTSRSA